MDIQEVLTEYKRKFKIDPLFIRIQDEGLENELFKNQDYFSKISFSGSYSSTQAVIHLNIPGKEQTLINYIKRHDLQSYLNIAKQGRFYKYDWISLFKFKMIFLLNENDFTPMDIAGIIGTEIETSIESRFRKSGKYTEMEYISNESHLRNIAEEVSQESMVNIIAAWQIFESYREKQLLLESKREGYETDLKLRKEHIWSIEGRIEDLKGYQSFMKVSNSFNTETSPGGVLGWLLKSKVPNQGVKQEKLQDEVTAIQEKLVKLEESKKESEEKKKELEGKIESVISELAQLKETAALYNPSNLLEETTNQRKGVSEHGQATNVIDIN